MLGLRGGVATGAGPPGRHTDAQGRRAPSTAWHSMAAVAAASAVTVAVLRCQM